MIELATGILNSYIFHNATKRGMKMTNEECISILRKIRQRAVGSTNSQLLDYIDGQIDVLSTIDTQSSSTPHFPSGVRTHVKDGTTGTANVGVSYAGTVKSTPRFRGADSNI